MNKPFKYTLGVIMMVASIALISFGGLVFAQSSVTPATCLGPLVAAREVSLDNAMATYSQSLDAAYTARATALAAANTQTGGNKAIHTSVKSSWSAFTASLKAARNSWRSARNSAWSTFNTSAKSCRATQSLSDADHSIQESSGN